MWRAGAICSLAIGCIGHTTLVAPPSTLSAEQRLAWFQTLSGRGVRTTWTVQTRTGFVTDVHKTIVLENGAEIEAAEDLLPVVAPDSTTARHARAPALAREIYGHADGNLVALMLRRCTGDFSLLCCWSAASPRPMRVRPPTRWIRPISGPRPPTARWTCRTRTVSWSRGCATSIATGSRLCGGIKSIRRPQRPRSLAR